MAKDRFKKAFEFLKPRAERLAVDTAKGYVFGCVFGVFSPSRKPLLHSMHESGKNFAKMSAAYSITDMTMEKTQLKNGVYGSFVSGAAAGAVGSKKGILPGSLLFGTYSGLSTYFQNLNRK
ncbi:hypothetical protein GINT2_000231 [Glugoides intestinalis]